MDTVMGKQVAGDPCVYDLLIGHGKKIETLSVEADAITVDENCGSAVLELGDKRVAAVRSSLVAWRSRPRLPAGQVYPSVADVEGIGFIAREGRTMRQWIRDLILGVEPAPDASSWAAFIDALETLETLARARFGCPTDADVAVLRAAARRIGARDQARPPR